MCINNEFISNNDHINWNDYFMYISLLSAMRSKDPIIKVGCCIVEKSHKRIISLGYNGFPFGCSDDIYPWGKGGNYKNDKRFYVCHAELNAILNCSNPSLLRDSVLYTTLFPCNECMKAIIQAGISMIIYLKDDDLNKDSTKASKRMANSAGIIIKQISVPEITIYP